MIIVNGDLIMFNRFKAKKGQMYTMVFWIITFVVVWSIFFGQFFAEWGQYAITQNNMVGIEAFLWGNLNLFIGLFLMLVMFAGVSNFGSGQR